MQQLDRTALPLKTLSVLIIGWCISTLLLLIVIFNQPLELFDRYGRMDIFFAAPNGSSLLGQKIKTQFNELSYTGPTLLHFHDTHCDCSKSVPDYILDLHKRLVPNDTEKVLVTNAEKNSWQELKNRFAVNRIIQFNTVNVREWLPATPAAALFDNRGELAYFGPHLGGKFCGSSSVNQLEWALNLIARGENLNIISASSRGCFCET